MGMWDVELNELLEFQQKFIDHAVSIQILSKHLNRSIEEAGELLRDEISKRNLEKVKEISVYMEHIVIYAADEMKRQIEKTKKQIERFENL